MNALAGQDGEAFDRLAGRAAALLDAPAGPVSLADADRQLLQSCAGLGEPDASGRELPTEWGPCPHVLAREELLPGRHGEWLRQHPRASLRPP